MGYYGLLLIDYVEHNPKITEESIDRWNKTIFSAEYSNGENYCKVDLLDTTKIEISVGNKLDATILNEEYKLVKDTIIVIGGIKQAGKYLNSNKFLLKGNKLLYKIDPAGCFDTTAFMTVKVNKMKQ